MPMKVCTNKVETQNLASHELALRDMAVHMYANEVCTNKVETQNLASPEGILRYMAVRMCAGENMLYLLVRRKILRLYWLARQM